MTETYRHHFQGMCDRLNYNCVVFRKETGEVLAYRGQHAEDDLRPVTCSVNIDYESIPAENSRVFYGLTLAFDKRVQIVSGSVSLIDVDGGTLVVVFFDARISTFRDNQLPRIFWKDAQGVYRGHSDYVPYENDLKETMVGKTDAELFPKRHTAEYDHSDRAILEKEVCFWDMMGKIKANVFTTLVKIEKFPYYSLDNCLLGILIVYWPVNESIGATADDDDMKQMQALINRALSDAHVYLIVNSVGESTRIEYYSDNLNHLGYDFEMFIDGRMTLKDIIYPPDLDRYLVEVKEILYSRRESYSTTIRLFNAAKDVVWAKISLSPLLGDNNRIRKVAMILQFPESYQDEGLNYQRFIAIANRTHTVYTVRNLGDPYHFVVVTDNVSQFGYSAQEFTIGKMQYRELLHPSDLETYQREIGDLVNRRIRQTVLEYRVVNRKKQHFWVKESLFVLNVGGIEYLESAITNVTTTKNAVDQLRTLEPTLPEGPVPDFNLMTAIRHVDLASLLRSFSEKSGVGALLFNNSGGLLWETRENVKTWEIIRESLDDYESLALTPVLKSRYADLALAVHPVERHGARLGSLLLFGRLNGVREGVRLVNDLGLFPPLSPGQLEGVYRYAGIVADNVAAMIEVAAVTTLEIHADSSLRGDADRQRRMTDVYLEISEPAVAASGLREAFRRIAPTIGGAVQLSRISLFSLEAEGRFDLVEEWYDESMPRIGRESRGNLLSATFLADWNIGEAPIFVVNDSDLVTDPTGTRENARAAVGVRIMKGSVPWGLAVFVDNQSRRTWTEDEKIFFESVGILLHGALERELASGRKGGHRTDFVKVLDSLPSAVAIVNEDNAAILYANAFFSDLFLRREMTAGGLRGEAYVRSFLAAEPTAKAIKELYLKEVDRWFIVNRSPIDYEGAQNAELVILTEITANKKTQETISSLAYTDVLTGLPNRSRFEADLKKTFELSPAMYANSFVGILNIDNFKLINNMYSYSFGDALLKTITIHLNKIPEIQGKIYRFGGDEFSFLVKNLYGEQVYEVAHKVMRLFEAPFYIDGYETACTVSLGIAFLTDTNKDPDDLIRKANLALSDAKTNGKNKFVLFDVSLQKYQEDTVSLERALKGAVDEGCGEFKVFYQPIVDAKTGKITAAEALVRWFSDEYGFVSPVKFIPVAEQTGLIIPLGKHILNTAVKEAKKWLDYGLDIAVSVNFSVIQILQTDLVQTLLKALQTYRLPAKNLIFEVTESLAVDDIQKIIEILTAVRQIGVRIAMDDFGTGYSSLNHLRRMPLDIVKIDRSFIFNIEFDPYTVSFVDTIAKFCHMKGTRICCEGIENETQKALLKGVMVDHLQGYLFGKPAPAEEFWKRLTHE
ncbi:MAG: EAL domain-containing protein [Candidatus Izemoplasmatales bacterium]